MLSLFTFLYLFIYFHYLSGHGFTAISGGKPLSNRLAKLVTVLELGHHCSMWFGQSDHT